MNHNTLYKYHTNIVIIYITTKGQEYKHHLHQNLTKDAFQSGLYVYHTNAMDYQDLSY